MADTPGRRWRMALCLGTAIVLVSVAWWGYGRLILVVPETGRNGLIEVPRLLTLLCGGAAIAGAFGFAAGRFIGRS